MLARFLFNKNTLLLFYKNKKQQLFSDPEKALSKPVQLISVWLMSFIPFILSESIVALTSLDFLGLGLSQDYPSLGDLVRQGKDNLQAPWIGITIFVVLAGLLTMLIFIGEGVRDSFDARKSK